MNTSTYMALIEEQFDQPLELDRLEAACRRDPELDDTQRMQVEERIGQYRNVDRRRQFSPDLGENVDGDDDGAA